MAKKAATKKIEREQWPLRPPKGFGERIAKELCVDGEPRAHFVNQIIAVLLAKRAVVVRDNEGSIVGIKACPAAQWEELSEITETRGAPKGNTNAKKK